MSHRSIWNCVMLHWTPKGSFLWISVPKALISSEIRVKFLKENLKISSANVRLKFWNNGKPIPLVY